MKQYKFKYKGEWYDIEYYESLGESYRPEYWVADYKRYSSDGEFITSSFTLTEPTLPKLLKELKNRNIEVIEVCDKLSWRTISRCDELLDIKTSTILRGKTAGHYYVFENFDGKYTCGFKPAEENKLYTELGQSKNLKEAKAICQKDYEKRKIK